MDYSGWLQRAEGFVRSLRKMPGNWGIEVAVEPPLSQPEAVELGGKLPLGLPSPLCEFYTTAAAACCSTYFWEPDEAGLSLIAEVLPHQYSLYGGPGFIPAVELEDACASVRAWATGYDETPNTPPRPGWELWHEAVPFHAIGNGDYLALHVTEGSARLPVLYLCHDADYETDGGAAFEISPSFEEFLTRWERLCYIGPEHWLLNTFLSEDCQADEAKETCWREIILACVED